MSPLALLLVGQTFWVSDESINAIVRIDAAGTSSVVISTPDEGPDAASALAIDHAAGRVYYFDAGRSTIRSASLVGPEEVVTIAAAGTQVEAIAVGGGFVYWAELTPSARVWRKPLGAGTAEALPGGFDHPHDLEIDGARGHLYVSDGAGITRMALDGSDRRTADLDRCAWSLALDAARDRLFYSCEREIRSIPLGVDTATTGVVSIDFAPARPFAIDLAGSDLLVAVEGGSVAPRLARCTPGMPTCEGLLPSGSHPRAVAWARELGWMLWGDSGSGGIQVMERPGAAPRELLAPAIDGPLRLVVDVEGGAVFWLAQHGTCALAARDFVECNAVIQTVGTNGRGLSTLRADARAIGLWIDRPARMLYWSTIDGEIWRRDLAAGTDALVAEVAEPADHVQSLDGGVSGDRIFYKIRTSRRAASQVWSMALDGSDHRLEGEAGRAADFSFAVDAQGATYWGRHGEPAELVQKRPSEEASVLLTRGAPPIFLHATGDRLFWFGASSGVISSALFDGSDVRSDAEAPFASGLFVDMPPGEAADEGCGCRSTRADGALLAALVVLGLFMARRRSR